MWTRSERRSPDPVSCVPDWGRSTQRTAELVEAVRSAGGVATSAGSGGAVLAVPLRVDAAELAQRLELVGLPAAAVPLRPSDPGSAGREHH